MPRTTKTTPRHHQDVFFLQQPHELHIICQRAPGEKVKRPGRRHQFISCRFQATYEPVSLPTVEFHIHANPLEFDNESLHQSGCIDKSEDPIGQSQSPYKIVDLVGAWMDRDKSDPFPRDGEIL